MYWLFLPSLGRGAGAEDNGRRTKVPPNTKPSTKTLKKISEDIERLQFNTCVSQFMICVNELNDLNAPGGQFLQPLLIALAPFAPFVTEELWGLMAIAAACITLHSRLSKKKYLVESASTIRLYQWQDACYYSIGAGPRRS